MSEIEAGSEIIILGGGISGLATAWYLHKAGIPFKLFEKSNETGGVISSSIAQGSVLDFGPNSLRDRNGEIRKLAGELGISDDLIQVSEAFKTRYIVRDGKLQSLSPSLGSLISTKILSRKGKLRAMIEPFIPQGNSADESVGEFLERRIGKEAVEFLADPVFSGIYAGDIYQMSKKEILPKLAEFEDEFGSLLWGAIRSKKEKKTMKPMVLSFRKGIQQLTDAITDRLSAHIINEEAVSLQKIENGFEIETGENVYKAEEVISCIPAYSLAQILKGFDPVFPTILSDIDYPPMLSTQVIYDKDAIDIQKPGFGFLIPRKENIRLLGAIWKSNIFPELTLNDKLHFTLLTGGAHDRKVLSETIKDIEEEVIAEFVDLMGFSEQPGYVKSKLWRKAIPQFEVGYDKTKNRISIVEKENPGLHIWGSYRWGVSVPDCISGAKKATENLMH